MIDSHCHLDDPRLAPHLDAVLARAAKAGVKRFIVCGVSADGWGRLAGLARARPGIHPAYGIHPWHCGHAPANAMDALAAQLTDAVALGECGLDFTPGRPSAAVQIDWLRRQAGLAREMRKPLILHCVHACEALLESIGGMGLSGVVHGFGGTPQEAMRLLDAGFYIGLGTRMLRIEGGLTRRAKALLRVIPPDRLLLESDAPDGAPAGSRAPNEPARLPALAAAIAQETGRSAQELADTADRNARRLFSLPAGKEESPCKTSTNAPAS